MRLVLIVDDEPSIRRATRRILEHAGYAVSESSNAVDALVQVERSRPDIVITDVHMPGGNGFDLTRSVRRGDHRQPRVIVVSGDDADLVARQAHDLGASMLRKPFGREELLEAVGALAPAPLRGVRILLVDDQPDVSLALRYLLETEGLVVTMSMSARDALAYLAVHPVDVILTDLYMPGMDGLAMIRTIRSGRASAAPIIAYTGSALVDRQ